MAQHSSRGARVEFGAYVFDRATQRLTKDGAGTRLPRKASDLLALLVANRNLLVPRDRILAAVWPEGFIQESNLTQTIYLLRKALSADPAVIIENVPRHGYRLRVNDGISSAARGLQRSRRYRAAASAICAVLLTGLVLVSAPSRSGELPLNAREDADLALYHFDRFVDLNLARARFERVATEAPNAPQGYAGVALVDAIDGFDSPKRDRYCTEGRDAEARANAAGGSTLGHVASAMLHVTCDHSLRDAQRDLDEALALDPSDAVALMLRSRVAFWQGLPHDAVAFAAKAVASDPTSPESLLALGLAYYYDLDFHDARDTFTRLLEIMPDRTAALEFLARSDEGLGDYSAAAKVLPSVQLGPHNVEWVWAERARILAVTGRRSEALALLRRWSSVSNPESAAAAYAAAGEEKNAIADFEVFASQHELNAQVSWLNDFRFSGLRRKFPRLASSFVTWR